MRKKITSFVTLMMLSVVTAFAADLHTVATMTVAVPETGVAKNVEIKLTVIEDETVTINGNLPKETESLTLTFSIPVPVEGVIEVKVDNPSAITGLDLSGNKLTTLTVTGLDNLTDLDYSSNDLTTLTLSGLNKMRTFEVSGATLETLNITDLRKLETLTFDADALETLTLSGLEYLKELNISGDALVSLTVIDLKRLETLDLNGEFLTTLTLSGLTDLETLNVTGTALTSLDLSTSTGLINLNVSGNALTSLDLSNNNKLKTLNASGNGLASLKLPADAKFVSFEAKDQEVVVNVPFNYNRTDVDIYFNGEVQTVSEEEGDDEFSFSLSGDGEKIFSGTLTEIIRGERIVYNITFVAEEGVEIISANGVNEAIEGHNFQFTVLASDYSVVVLVDGEELLPIVGNTYVINSVDSDKEVTFILTKNEENPTSNETLTATSVSTTKGAIIVEAIASDVMIVSISGNVVYKAIVTGTETVNVAAGIYVVAINGKATKVVVR
jgi:Leucine-rich repeat (LRR) protein